MRIVRLAVVALLAAGAAALVAFSFVPYDQLKGHVDAFTVDRDADVTREEFDAIVWRLRVLAIGLGALATALVAFGRSVDRTTDAVARAWWAALRASPSSLRGWLARETHGFLAAAGAILVAACAVRIAYLGVPLRYDEATTYNNFVSKPLYVALANYATPNNHLLNTFLAKISVGALGNEVWAIRLPARGGGVPGDPPTPRPAPAAAARFFMSLSARHAVQVVLVLTNSRMPWAPSSRP